MIIFLEHLYKICKELEHHAEALDNLLDNKDHPNWDARAQFNFCGISNNIQYFKSRLIEFDNALNGIDDFGRHSLDIIRKEVQNSCQTTKMEEN